MALTPDLDTRFAYHQPPDERTTHAHAEVRLICGFAASQLDAMLPHSREKSLALTALQETMMWANGSIAIHGLTEDAVLPEA